MRIIPAIDIISGKCVRLTQGDYTQKKVYSNDPLEVAKKFEQAGIEQLHIVDLEGAKASQPVNLQILMDILSNTSLQVDFGGGVKSNESIDRVISTGVHQITAGSIAVNDKDMVKNWIQLFGSEKIILGADVRNEKIAINGWQEDSGVDLFEFLEDYLASGAEYCICTDVSKDGLLQGPSFDLYRRVLEAFPDLKLIASGGVSGINDLEELRTLGVYGTIVGKAYYEGRISFEEMASFNN